MRTFNNKVKMKCNSITKLSLEKLQFNIEIMVENN